ncbi:hypothetical protein HK104_003230 [Borealophlyctis nickersoniae]|nr:hypothetical protein HK104_003230 [Borealophlyctis nickersoniae]
MSSTDGLQRDDSPETPTRRRGSGRFLDRFKLDLVVAPRHFVTYLFAAATAICLFVFLNASQPTFFIKGFVLGQVLNLPKTELGNAAGSLSFYDELLSLPLVWVWGLASDRIGRKSVYAGGFAFMALGLGLFTYAKNLYPELLLYRLIFAVGGAASSSMLTAVLADYAGEKDRGKLSGIVGLMSGAGALIALFVFLRLPTYLGDAPRGLRITYLIVTAFSALFAIIVFFGLDGKRSKSDDRRSGASSEQVLIPDEERSGDSARVENVSRTEKPALLQLAKDGFWAARDLRVLLGYVSSFLARGDTIIITGFLPLWIYKHSIDIGLCNVSDPNDPDIKDSCYQAYRTASTLSGIAQTFALIGAPIFGYLLDRVYRPTIVLIAALTGLVGYLLLSITTDPTAEVMYLYVALIGLGEIGLVVGSLALVTANYVAPSVRGSVAGVCSLFGAVGILINTRLGGYLFDVWKPNAPFFVMFIAHAIACLIAGGVVVMYLVRRSRGGESGATSGENQTIPA